MNRTSLPLALALALTACDPANDDDSAAPDVPFAAVVLHGPFSGDATLQGLGPDGAALDVDPVGLAGTDWALGGGDDDFFLIGRLGTNVVRRYDWPATDAPVVEFSTGTPTNPQVARECGGAIFVTRYGLGAQGGGGDVAVFDLDGSPAGRVDLSAFVEGTDGTPEPSTMVELDGVLYVGLQRLDRDGGWVPDPVGKVVAIDCATAAVVDSWDTVSNVSVFAVGTTLYARGRDAVTRLDDSAFVSTPITDALDGTITGISAAGDRWIIGTESTDGVNTLWCVDSSGAAEQLEVGDTRAWSFATDPIGRAWVGWRDHWVTPEVEVGAVGIYDPATCAQQGWVELSSDPFDVAFTGIQ